MHVAFGRVRRKTEPTGLGTETVIFLKLTPMVRLGMHVAFGRVRRKTEPTGLGTETVIFSKIDTYGAVP